MQIYRLLKLHIIVTAVFKIHSHERWINATSHFICVFWNFWQIKKRKWNISLHICSFNLYIFGLHLAFMWKHMSDSIYIFQVFQERKISHWTCKGLKTSCIKYDTLGITRLRVLCYVFFYQSLVYTQRYLKVRQLSYSHTVPEAAWHWE